MLCRQLAVAKKDQKVVSTLGRITYALFGAIFRTAAKKKHFVQIQRIRDGRVSFKDYNAPYKSESKEGLSMAITAKAGNFQKQMYGVLAWFFVLFTGIPGTHFLGLVLWKYGVPFIVSQTMQLYRIESLLQLAKLLPTEKSTVCNKIFHRVNPGNLLTIYYPSPHVSMLNTMKRSLKYQAPGVICCTGFIIS